ncbi:pH nine-sensitive protein 1, variant 2 [Entomophthora muscae]|nr:pH nine-sensitive protein 1, variant 2 [Entomophthora muscae]
MAYWWITTVIIIISTYVLFVTCEYIQGVLSLTLAFAFVYFSFFCKKHIPLARLIMISSNKFLKKHPMIICIVMVSLFVILAYLFLVGLMLDQLVGKYTTATCKATPLDFCSKLEFQVIWFFLVFSVAWVTKLIIIIIGMTVTGVFAADYFKRPSSILKSLGCALTLHFGSACLGSFTGVIPDILELALVIIYCLVSLYSGWLANIIKTTLDFFLKMINRFPYCYCVINKVSYGDATEATWIMLRDRGVDAIANEAMVESVLAVGVIMISLMSCIRVHNLLNYSQSQGFAQYIRQLIDTSIIYSLIANFVVLFPVQISSTCMFVLLAQDPRALAISDPLLYAEICKAYPGVTTPV